jgi:predicted XRE-type DNA-binding protein
MARAKKTYIRKKTKARPVIQSSGNVFADLGLPDAEEALAKARLAQRIATVIEKKGMTQMQAAATLNIDQPKVSALLRGRLTGFSTERLFRFLTALDQDIQIVIREKPSRARRHATLSVATEKMRSSLPPASAKKTKHPLAGRKHESSPPLQPIQPPSRYT